jgi:hypothetical protein
MLVRGVIVEDGVDQPAGTAASTVLRKRMKSWWRAMQRPMAVPSSTFSAANSVVVACRM